MTNEPEYVVASLEPYPEVWNYAETAEAAVRLAAAVPPCSGRHYAAMTTVDFRAAERRHHLNQPPLYITPAKWDEMVHAPELMNWRRDEGFEHFMLPQREVCRLVRQYARLDEDRHVTKLVDVADPSTWLTREQLAAMPERSSPENIREVLADMLPLSETLELTGQKRRMGETDEDVFARLRAMSRPTHLQLVEQRRQEPQARAL